MIATTTTHTLWTINAVSTTLIGEAPISSVVVGALPYEEASALYFGYGWAHKSWMENGRRTFYRLSPVR